MTDAPFVIGAFAVVLASLGAYAATLGRRISAARRVVVAIEHERDRLGRAMGSEADEGADETAVRL